MRCCSPTPRMSVPARVPPHARRGLHDDDTALDALLSEILVAAGRMEGFLLGSGPTHTVAPLISRVTVMSDIVVVQRGPADAATVPVFTLESYTTRRP